MSAVSPAPVNTILDLPESRFPIRLGVENQRIRKLEKEMLDAAKNLEFERAASLRDELKAMRDRLMMVGGEG